MKYLVLGSSGQIGGHLVNFLQSKGCTVQCYDIVRNSCQDLRVASAELEIYMKEADFVFFLAFDVGGSAYLKTYQHTYQFIDNNVRLMQNTFLSLKRWNKPFIFASSQMANMTHSSYGVLKSLGDYYTKSLHLGVVVKFWNVYGIENDPAKTHVITDFIEMASKNKVIRMRTDGKEERQFLYAKDCSEALYTLSNLPIDKLRDEHLHITSFEWVSIKKVAETIASLYNGVTIVPGMLKDSVQLDMRNEPNRHIIKYWSPSTSLEEGIKQIVSHYEYMHMR